MQYHVLHIFIYGACVFQINRISIKAYSNYVSMCISITVFICDKKSKWYRCLKVSGNYICTTFHQWKPRVSLLSLTLNHGHTCQLTQFRRVTPDFSILHSIIFYDPAGHDFHSIFVQLPKNLPISGFGL